MSLAENEQAAPTAATPSILPAGAMTPTRFSVAQFDAMIDGGIFPADSDRKIQLPRGEIVTMTPASPRHDDVLCLLSAWVFGQLNDASERNVSKSASNSRWTWWSRTAWCCLI